MAQQTQGTILRKSNFTRKCWLQNAYGKRTTPKFEIYNEKSFGDFVRLSTSIGILVYHKHQNEPIFLGKFRVDMAVVEKITESIYSVSYSRVYSRSLTHRLYTADGNRLLDQEFKGIINMGGNLLGVCTDNGWGILECSNVQKLQWVMLPELTGIDNFNEFGYAVLYFSQDKGLAIVDKNLKQVLGTIPYDRAEFLTEDLILVRQQGKFGVINLQGDIVVPVIYKSITMSGDCFIVELDKYGLMDKTGKVLLECIYDEVIETPDKFVVRDYSKIEISITKEVAK